MKRVLVVGSEGQDGTLLRLLLEQQSIAYLGVSRRGIHGSSGETLPAIDLGNAEAVENLVQTFRPSEVFYLAAHHHSSQDRFEVRQSDLWQASLDVQVRGLIHFLEALRLHQPAARLFYAASSHVFGSPSEFPQTEKTPLVPDNIYGITKVAGMHACRHYREQYGLFASVGILYNHESIYRQEKFLSKKIILGALAIRQGRQQNLVLGDHASEADWGYAPDYVEAMTRILALPQPGDYIIATGQLHTVRDFARIVFEELGMDYTKYVVENPGLIRQQRSRLVGDANRLQADTGWKPGLAFEQMVRLLTRQVEAGGIEKTTPEAGQ